MRTICLLLLCLVTSSSVRSRAADEVAPSLDADQPYRLLVVLRFSKTPQFSPYFVDRIRRQLVDHLTTYFGSLAAVDVELFDTLREHSAADDERDDSRSGIGPALAQLGDRDIDGLSAADLIKQRVTAQVLLLDFSLAAEGYQIRWRRWDGRTQQLAPSQSTSIADRQLLGKAACLVVCKGFSPAATIHPAGNRVELAFQGDKWRSELIRSLQLPCIMQAIRVEKRRDGSLAHEPIPDSVVVVQQGKSGLEFRAYSNRANPWQTGSRLVRFEAIKLLTTRGRFTLRILDEQSRDPLSSCVVYANDRGFSEITDADLLGTPDRNGYVASKGPLDRLAFIKITQGRSSEALLPLVITSSSLERTILIPRDRAAGLKAEFERRMQALIRDVGFVRSFHNLGVDEINDLTQEKRYEEARDRAEHLSKTLQDMTSPMRQLNSQLRTEADSLRINAAKRFVGIGESLQKIDADIRTVGELSANLAKIIKVNDQRGRATVAIDLGKAKEQSCDFDEAIANYEQALQEVPDQPKLAHRLEQLKHIWKIKSPEHQQARKFVYEDWANLDPSRLDDFLPRAESAIETLVKVNDYLTARKFNLANEGLLDDMAAAASQLQDSEQPDDRAEVDRIRQGIEQIAELSNRLGQIQQPESAADDSPTALPSSDAGSTNEDAPER